MRRFDGRAAIVTGASSGIGEAIARRLASEGASLVLLGGPGDESDLRRVGTELAEGGASVATVAGDVGSEDTARRLVSTAAELPDPLRLVAANAGIGLVAEPLATPLEQWDAQLTTNARGMFLTCMATARAMADGRGGAIVCTASTASFVGEEEQVAYNASKGAVVALVRSLGVGLAPYGIRVNAVAPGWVRTRVTAAGIDDPAAWAAPRTRIPMDRAAAPAEIAAAAAFLLSDDASYVTGATLLVDGGATAGFRNSDWAAAPHDVAPRALRIWSDQDV